MVFNLSMQNTLYRGPHFSYPSNLPARSTLEDWFSSPLTFLSIPDDFRISDPGERSRIAGSGTLYSVLGFRYAPQDIGVNR